MMKWVIIDSEGGIDRILNLFEPGFHPGVEAIELDVPEDYPEFKQWDAATQTFAPALDLARDRKWSQIKAIRDEKFKIADTPYGPFDSDEVSKSNINGQIAAFDNMERLGLSLPETVTWKLADNSFVELTPVEFREAGLVVAQCIADTYAKSWQAKAQIDDPTKTTIAEIEAVQWPA